MLQGQKNMSRLFNYKPVDMFSTVSFKHVCKSFFVEESLCEQRSDANTSLRLSEAQTNYKHEDLFLTVLLGFVF